MIVDSGVWLSYFFVSARVHSRKMSKNAAISSKVLYNGTGAMLITLGSRQSVITPAFVSDCLETLEEIAMEGEEEFIEAGGESFKHISCLNDSDAWVALMKDWVTQWETTSELPYV